MQNVTSWSSDGRWIAFTESHPETKEDIWVLPMQRPPADPLSPDSILRVLGCVLARRELDRVYIRRFHTTRNLRHGVSRPGSFAGRTPPTAACCRCFHATAAGCSTVARSHIRRRRPDAAFALDERAARGLRDPGRVGEYRSSVSCQHEWRSSSVPEGTTPAERTHDSCHRELVRRPPADHRRAMTARSSSVLTPRGSSYAV